MDAANDTLQRWLDTAPAGLWTTGPAGEFWIDASRPLKPRSGARLDLTPMTLKVIANGLEKYAAIELDGVSDVVLKNGVIVGDREFHTGKTGEWGFGVSIRKASTVVVQGTKASKCWGDGFYVSGAKNVLLTGVVADSNRRQGLSVIDVDGLMVTGSTFANTHGTRPECGVDIEPDKSSAGIRNVVFSKCAFKNNKSSGLAINTNRPALIKNIVVKPDCVFSGNGNHSIKSFTYGWFEKVLWDLGLWDPKEIEI